MSTDLTPRSDQESAREAAEARAELLRLAQEQGVKPFDFDRERDDFWPEDESADEFLAWLRSMRAQGGAPRRLPE